MQDIFETLNKLYEEIDSKIVISKSNMYTNIGDQVAYANYYIYNKELDTTIELELDYTYDLDDFDYYFEDYYGDKMLKSVDVFLSDPEIVINPEDEHNPSIEEAAKILGISVEEFKKTLDEVKKMATEVVSKELEKKILADVDLWSEILEKKLDREPDYWPN